jgi:hypothetical protein
VRYLTVADDPLAIDGDDLDIDARDNAGVVPPRYKLDHIGTHSG